MAKNEITIQESKLPERLPMAKYAGEITLNGFKITCAILDDGRRVFSERSLATAFGIKGGGAYWEKKKKEGGAVLPEYLSAKYLEPFITNELRVKFNSAFSYISTNGKISNGVDATVLTDICDVYIIAEKSGKIKVRGFSVIAENAYNMLKAFSNEGILRLIDKALGYQYEAEEVEIQTILRLFISPDILEWQKTFHLGFYKEIFRLWNVPFIPETIRKKPPFIGMLTNELVYKNLPKGSFVLNRLKEKTSKTIGGNYKVRLFQSLTPLGKEELRKVIYSIETLANVSETKEQFRRLLKNRYGQKELPFEDLETISKPKEIKQIDVHKKPLGDFDKVVKKFLDTPPPKKDK